MSAECDEVGLFFLFFSSHPWKREWSSVDDRKYTTGKDYCRSIPTQVENGFLNCYFIRSKIVVIFYTYIYKTFKIFTIYLEGNREKTWGSEDTTAKTHQSRNSNTDWCQEFTKGSGVVIYKGEADGPRNDSCEWRHGKNQVHLPLSFVASVTEEDQFLLIDNRGIVSFPWFSPWAMNKSQNIYISFFVVQVFDYWVLHKE